MSARPNLAEYFSIRWMEILVIIVSHSRRVDKNPFDKIIHCQSNKINIILRITIKISYITRQFESNAWQAKFYRKPAKEFRVCGRQIVESFSRVCSESYVVQNYVHRQVWTSSILEKSIHSALMFRSWISNFIFAATYSRPLSCFCPFSVLWSLLRQFATFLAFSAASVIKIWLLQS